MSKNEQKEVIVKIKLPATLPLVANVLETAKDRLESDSLVELCVDVHGEQWIKITGLESDY